MTRLLKKAPDARFQSAADLVWALEQVAHVPADIDAHPTTVSASTVTRRPRWLAVGPGASTRSCVSGGWLAGCGERPVADLTRCRCFGAIWPLPEGMVLDSAPVVSPDGQHVAFVGETMDRGVGCSSGIALL